MSVLIRTDKCSNTRLKEYKKEIKLAVEKKQTHIREVKYC